MRALRILHTIVVLPFVRTQGAISKTAAVFLVIYIAFLEYPHGSSTK
jgi:hypothetical protein